MNDERLWYAFSKIVEESISNSAIRNKILRDVRAHLDSNASFPAKGILATISEHKDMQASEESANLIKEIFYYYG